MFFKYQLHGHELFVLIWSLSISDHVGQGYRPLELRGIGALIS